MYRNGMLQSQRIRPDEWNDQTHGKCYVRVVALMSPEIVLDNSSCPPLDNLSYRRRPEYGRCHLRQVAHKLPTIRLKVSSLRRSLLNQAPLATSGQATGAALFHLRARRRGSVSMSVHVRSLVASRPPRRGCRVQVDVERKDVKRKDKRDGPLENSPTVVLSAESASCECDCQDDL
jgi:hypothetical protein